MKQGSTMFLRLSVLIMGFIGLVFGGLILPSVWVDAPLEFPKAHAALVAIVIGLYMSAIGYYGALWQTLKLLKYIDQNMAFSELTVSALKNIKRCAIWMSCIWVFFVPLFFPLAQEDDAPGLIIVGAILACAPITIAVFAAVLEKLVRSAIALKAENDLTV